MYNFMNYLFKVLCLVRDVEPSMAKPGDGRMLVRYGNKLFSIDVKDVSCVETIAK